MEFGQSESVLQITPADAEFTIKVGKKQVKYLGQVIPAPLLIARYFSQEQTNLDTINSDLEQATQSKEEFEEEHGGDDGALSEGKGNNGKMSKGVVQSRVLSLKETIMADFPENSSQYNQVKAITKSAFGTKPWTTGVEDENGDFAELDALYEWLRLNEAEGAAKKNSKAALAALMQKVAEQYPKLS